MTNFKHLKLIVAIYKMTKIDTFSSQYQENLSGVLGRWIDHNPRLNAKIDKEVTKFLSKNDGKSRTKTQLRLYNKALQSFTHNVSWCLAQDLLNYRLHQFGRWFIYMWGNPVLCSKTYYRLAAKYPYKTTHFLRQFRVKLPPPPTSKTRQKKIEAE